MKNNAKFCVIVESCSHDRKPIALMPLIRTSPSRDGKRVLFGTEAIQLAVDIADNEFACRDGGRGDDVAPRFVFPLLLAGREIKPVEPAVAGADVHSVADDNRRRLDVSFRGKRPNFGTAIRLDASNLAIIAAEHDKSAGQCGR